MRLLTNRQIQALKDEATMAQLETDTQLREEWGRWKNRLAELFDAISDTEGRIAKERVEMQSLYGELDTKLKKLRNEVSQQIETLKPKPFIPWPYYWTAVAFLAVTWIYTMISNGPLRPCP